MGDEMILTAFYHKYMPTFANGAKTGAVMRSFQEKAKQKSHTGEDWRDLMFSSMKTQYGEDPRAFYSHQVGTVPPSQAETGKAAAVAKKPPLSKHLHSSVPADAAELDVATTEK